MRFVIIRGKGSRDKLILLSSTSKEAKNQIQESKRNSFTIGCSETCPVKSWKNSPLFSNARSWASKKCVFRHKIDNLGACL